MPSLLPVYTHRVQEMPHAIMAFDTVVMAHENVVGHCIQDMAVKGLGTVDGCNLCDMVLAMPLLKLALWTLASVHEVM